MEKPKYLKHPVNGRVLPWAQILAERGDMINCDADGNPLNEDCVMPVVEQFEMPEIIFNSIDGWGLGNPEKQMQFEQLLLEIYKKANAEDVHGESSSYDDLMGVLPDWIPERERIRFGWERNLLLNQYSHEEIRGYMELYPKYIEGKLDELRFAQMRSELLHAIGYLVLIRNAIDSGVEEGIKMLAGEYAVRGYKAYENSRRRAEKANKDKVKARNFCVELAAKLWEAENKEGKPITRIGAMSLQLLNMLHKEGYWQPTDYEKIRDWLKKADRKGEMIIPEEARKSGAPSK